MRFITPLFVAALLINACTPKADGGNCDYQVHRPLAEVIAITPYAEADYPDGASRDPELFHIEMEFSTSTLGDSPQFLEDLLETNIDAEFIATNRIVVGNKYKTDVSELIEGSCEPIFVSFDHRFKLDE